MCLHTCILVCVSNVMDCGTGEARKSFATTAKNTKGKSQLLLLSIMVATTPKLESRTMLPPPLAPLTALWGQKVWQTASHALPWRASVAAKT